jgi:hypothetical protein
MAFIKRVPRPGKKFYLVLFGLALAIAAYIRFWAAPYSAGADVPQFWAFAKMFQIHGLDFYRYADASTDFFPTPGWGYLYPPIWLLISRLSLIAAPLSHATATFVDISWRVAIKTPIIGADLAIGCLLYWAIPGARWRKLLFSCLWLFNPTAWYNSAVFGQFDAIAAALLLASIITLEKGKDRLAFLLAGLAVMTKQHTLIPVAIMIAVTARSMGWRRLLTNVAIMAGVVVVFSVPFVVTGNFIAYARSILFAGQPPGYQEPLMYAFNGSGAVATYLHLHFGWDIGRYLIINLPVLLVALMALFFVSFKRQVTPAQGALAGFLVFLSFMYRVNYQYLIVYIPIALLIASRTRFQSERIITIILAMLPAVWVWLYEVAFWFDYLEPISPQARPVLERLGFTRIGTPEWAYVALAVALMGLFLAYTVCAYTRWRKHQVL